MTWNPSLQNRGVSQQLMFWGPPRLNAVSIRVFGNRNIFGNPLNNYTVNYTKKTRHGLLCSYSSFALRSSIVLHAPWPFRIPKRRPAIETLALHLRIVYFLNRWSVLIRSLYVQANLKSFVPLKTSDSFLASFLRLTLFFLTLFILGTLNILMGIHVSKIFVLCRSCTRKLQIFF